MTYATGHACYKAAEDVKAEMCLRAARQLEVDESDIEYQKDDVVCKSDTSKSLFKEIAAEQGRTGGPITGKGTINAISSQNAFGTHIVDVEVDTETGKVKILRCTPPSKT